jgi:hypothetical protein
MSWQVTTEKTGTKEEVEEFVKRYFEDYHPAGYGTRVESMYTKPDGSYYVKISRARSCD